MYCSKCGQEIVDEAVVCIHCGCATTNNALSKVKSDDAPSGGYTALGFFFPLIGLILYLVWNGDYPQRAKSVGKGALIGFITCVAIIVLCYILIFAIAAFAISASNRCF